MPTNQTTGQRKAANWGISLRNTVALVCLFVAGLADGTRDALQFHFDRTPFADASTYQAQFWNPAVSWKNKYTDGQPSRGERFPLSSTALVFVTDGWHLLKFTMINSFLLAILLFQLPASSGLPFRMRVATAGLAFVILHGSFSIGFALAYR